MGEKYLPQLSLIKLCNCFLKPASAEEALAGENTVRYELMASVAYIRDAQRGGNLVAHILASESYHERKENVSRRAWYLFNDFAVTPISKVSCNGFLFCIK